MTLTLQPPRVAITDGTGTVTREWYRYFLDLQVRVGGYDAQSNDELSAGAFEDAGIEETKAELYRLRDDLMTAPRSELVAAVEHMETQLAEVMAQLAVLQDRLDHMGIAPDASELMAQIPVLQAQIQDLNQG